MVINHPLPGNIPDEVLTESEASALYLPLDGTKAMIGPLKLNNSHNSNPGDVSKGLILYSGNDPIGIAASGQPEGDIALDVSTGRMNLVTSHPDNNIYLRVDADRAFASKRGFEIVTGHSIYIEGQSIEERYLKTTGGKVTGELEVEGDLHIHGDHNVDIPKLIIKDQDSDERYWLRTETPSGGGSSFIGDIKQSLVTEDHSGWIILNGRAVSTLTEDQQLAASGILGFTTNIPDATDCVLMQGPNLGVVSGSMSRTITTNQMPRHFHSVPAITNDQGVHGFGDMVNPDSGRAYPLTIMRGSAEIININNQNPDSGHMPNYGRMMEDAGNDEPLDITPKSLSINMFVYLGA